jgi:hypothetical protein
MNGKWISILIVTLVLLTACNSHSSHSTYYNSFEQVVKIPSHVGEKYPLLKPLYKFGTGKTFLLGQPTGIANLGPYTIVTDISDQEIHIFKDTTHIKTVGRHGRGPGEFLNIGVIQAEPKDHSFWVYDPTLFRFQKFNLDSILKNLKAKKYITKTVNVKSKIGYPNRPIWLNDTTIISHGFFTAKRIALFNAKGIFQRLTGPTLPGKKNKKVPYEVRGQAYMGFMAAKPDGSAFALADQYTDKIEIYDAQGHPKLLIIGADNFNPHYGMHHFSQGTTAMTFGKDMQWGYVGICATNHKIYALYCGKLQKNKNSGLGNSLYVFNWHGKLLGLYPFKSNSISAISINKSQGELYALDYYGKDPISVYNLPGKQ